MHSNQYSHLLIDPLEKVVALADSLRQEHEGETFDLCTITNAKSGSCTEDCRFCAQSGHYSTEIREYPLKPKKEMLDEAYAAKKNGAHRFCIVTSGNTLTEQDLSTVAETVTAVRDEVGMPCDASLGALPLFQLKMLKGAGLSRYHHNIETSRNFYPKIVSTHEYDERVNTVKAAKEAGLEVCSGGIIGLGESWQDRIDMAVLLKELDVDSVPINILNPIKGTPLEGSDNITPVDAIRTIAIFRIILKDKTIKVAAGRETKLKDHQELAFRAGANGMLIGGYLTIKGRPVEEDQVLVAKVKAGWNNEGRTKSQEAKPHLF